MVQAPAVNQSRPGAGGAEVHVRSPDDETWIQRAVPSGNATWHVEEPTPGNWRVQVQPLGVVANQAWHVSASLAGLSGEPSLFGADNAC